MSAAASRYAIEDSRRAILDEIGDSPDLFFVRGLGNRGDELIWAGTRRLLSDRIYREVSIEELCSVSGHTVLLSGSGAFSRAYHEWMPRALAVAEQRFQRTIVLPSSFDPGEDLVRAALARTGATLFAREPASYRRIRSLCDARLAHDCAFFFDFAPFRRAGRGTLNVFRTDREAMRPETPPEDNEDISVTADSLGAWLERIAAHELIRTDRAHVMIAGALLGKRVQYHPGPYHKLSAIAEYGLAEHRVRPISGSANGNVSSRRWVPVASDREPPKRSRRAAARVTAIVLTRDRPQSALRALESLSRQREKTDVLVLDNNSAPSSADALAAACAEHDGVTLRRSDRNLGCAGGRRLGTQLTASELVLFLDDDAELRPGAVDRMVAELDADRDAAAIAATVTEPDGKVHHSGGELRVCDGVAEFTLIGNGGGLEELPPTGTAGWVPGTAALLRREVLEAFPIDPGMTSYHEDNEWCYRVEHSRPGSFLRSREAVAIHHLRSKLVPGTTFVARSSRVELLCGHARFYQRHGVLLGMSLPELIPELMVDGEFDRAAARLLMELLLARGPDWVLAEWMNGGLDALLSGRRRLATARSETEELRRELAGTQEDLARQCEEMTDLRISHETLVRIENGGWWRLRSRMLPVVRQYQRLRGRAAS